MKLTLTIELPKKDERYGDELVEEIDKVIERMNTWHNLSIEKTWNAD